jgi:hypothetical protein
MRTTGEAAPSVILDGSDPSFGTSFGHEPGLRIAWNKTFTIGVVGL